MFIRKKLSTFKIECIFPLGYSYGFNFCLSVIEMKSYYHEKLSTK